MSATYTVSIGGQAFGLDAELRDDAGSGEFFTWTDETPNCPRCGDALLTEGAKTPQASVVHLFPFESVVACDGCGWNSELLEAS